MAVRAGTVYVDVRANTSGLTAQISRDVGGIGSRLSSAGAGLSRFGSSMTRYVSVPLAAAGVASVKLALDFERGFTKMNTLAGVSRSEIAALKREVLGLSGETAQAPQDLAEALYFIRSSGFEGAAAIDVLTVSAKAAAAGLGDTKTVADAVTSAMNAYGPANLKAAEATDTLIGAVRSGKGEASEIAAVIGRVIPLASELGVTFQDVGAATASMTLSGLDASEATTALRGIFTSLLKPTIDGEAALKDMGLTVGDLREQMGEEGLLNTLIDLKGEIGNNKEALADIFPNVRALAGFLNLTGQRADENVKIFDKLGDAVGETDKAFEKATKGAGFKFDQAMNDLRLAGMKLGTELIPVLVDQVIPAVRDAAKWFSKLSPEALGLGIKLAGLAIVAGPVIRIAGALVSLGGALAKVVPWLLKWPKGPFPIPTGGIPGGGKAPTPVPVGGVKGALRGAGRLVGLAGIAYALGDISTVPVEDFSERVNNATKLLELDIKSAGGALEGMGTRAEYVASQVRGFNDELAESGSDIRISAEAFRYAAKTGQSYSDVVARLGGGFAVTSQKLQRQFLPALERGRDITLKEQRALAGLVNKVGDLGGSLDKNTRQMLGNVLAFGDAEAAARVLKAKLEELRQKLGEKYEVKVDTSGATAQLNSFVAAFQGRVIGMTVVANQTYPTPYVGGGEHGAFIPGAAKGGYVHRQQVIRVGEKSKSEMILPLEDRRGAEALQKAMEGALLSVMGGGTRGKDSAFLEIRGFHRAGLRLDADRDWSYAQWGW